MGESRRIVLRATSNGTSRRERDRVVAAEDAAHRRVHGAQPSPTAPGVCACSLCGWRAIKIVAALSGWDARDKGAAVACRWCRKRLRALGHGDPLQLSLL